MRALVENLESGYLMYHGGEAWLLSDVKPIGHAVLLIMGGNHIMLPKGTEVICERPQPKKSFFAGLFG